MKKLMIAAAAAAMIGGAYAVNDLPYVYQVRMNVLTTKAMQCSGTTPYSIPCAQPGVAGQNGYARTMDSYAICGYIFGCADGCENIKDLANGYAGWKLKENQNSTGIVLWDVVHSVPFVAKAGDRKWNNKQAGFFQFQVLDLLYPGTVSEMAFRFTGVALFADANGTIYENTFNLTGAGFGQYAAIPQRVATGYTAANGYTYETRTAYAWLSTSGNLAGTMTAPYVMADGIKTVQTPVQTVDGWTCGDVCGQNNGNSSTAAYGTWSIAYNAALSQAFGVQFGKTIKPYVPAYVPGFVYE